MTYRIATIPGDGIGPEVIREAVRALMRVAERRKIRLDIVEYPFGAAHYFKTGETLGEASLAQVAESDAILLGAVGSPDVPPGILEQGIVGRLRRGLDLYVNLRPCRLYAEQLCPLKNKQCADIDFVTVRENTEDAYAQAGGVIHENTPREVRVQEMLYTYQGTERIIRYAFELARNRSGRRKLTLCDKANAIAAHALYRRVFAELSREFPDVNTEAAYVDALAMRMVTSPEQFDVIVTTNLFGDIITDLSAALQGGMGAAPAGNIHPGKLGMFEPVHGSAPDIAGKRIASPIAAILAAGMMLDYLGEKAAAADVTNAVAEVLRSGRVKSLGPDSGLRTDEITEMVLRAVSGDSIK